MSKVLLFAIVFVFTFSSFAQEKLPKVAREFRGMWISTVANLDFPSKKDLSPDKQKAELIKLLDLAVELRLNAVIFQVRSMGDAVYLSELEPSSYFLTGKMGKSLEFDPFKFLIDEAHSRGILVHAWFNPYRMSHSTFNGEFSDSHLTKKYPDWVREYNTLKWLDPGLPEVRDYLNTIVKDVVSRYDIDGVHFDDYFYPYLDSKQTDFPDSKTFEAYKSNGGKLKKEDWRRKNVDEFIQTVSLDIKKIKPKVMFGISPFGIWQPNDIDIKGTSSYDEHFADSRKWLHEGWVDYLSPQLYWSTVKEGQKFSVLLSWWKNENKRKRHLWVGLAPFKIGDENFADFSSKEIETQILMTRGTLNDNAGAIHFRALSLEDNRNNLRENLKKKIYNTNAIIPESPWIKTIKLQAPQLELNKDDAKNLLVASWKNAGADEVFRWVFYWKIAEKWNVAVLPFGQFNAEIPANIGAKMFAVAAVDRLGNISEPTFKEVK